MKTANKMLFKFYTIKRIFIFMKTTLWILIFYICANIQVFANSGSIQVDIKAQNYSNQIVYIASNQFNDSLLLNDYGVGSIILQFENKTFARVRFSSASNQPIDYIILKPNSDVGLTINEENIEFHGSTKELNDLFLKCSRYFEMKYDETQLLIDSNKPKNEITEKFKDCDDEFLEFLKTQPVNNHFSLADYSLIKDYFVSSFLAKKQLYLSSQSLNFNDKNELEKDLGISSHYLFKDSILLKANSIPFKNFLISYYDYRVQRDLPFDHYGAKLYPRAVENYFYNDSTYGEHVLEFISYVNLTSCFSYFGLTQQTYELWEDFKKKYPGSTYIKHLSELQLKSDSLSPGKPAPNFILKSNTSKEISLKDFKGKLILIDVWATWCGPCKKDIPNIQNLQNIFHDVTFLFISIDSDEEKWKEYLDEHQMGSSINLISNDSSFKELYRISGIPRYILINKDGFIINAFMEHYEGAIEKELRKVVNE